MIGDIAYTDYKKKNDIHGTILYPAVMVAPVQKDIINDIMRKATIKSIFDPFHGSGTALYEGFETLEKVNLVGCDINPLANLITKVKLQGVTQSIDEDISNLKRLISENSLQETYTFKNINKWFRKDIIEDLSLIRSSIMQIKNKKNRLYMWYMLCDIIRKYSNTRSSTYKLHVKSIDKIQDIENKVIYDYIKSLEDNKNKFEKGTNNFYLYKCDTLDMIKKFDENKFDLSITSPPYGENATTVPYGQFSMLSLYWIDYRDLELEGWELENYSKIDNKSLGGSSKEIHMDEFELNLIKPYIEKISIVKKDKVINFFNDYFIFLKELCRVTNKYIVMTLGNRTVDRININLTDITIKYLERFKFNNEQLIKRKIPHKRTPNKTSKVDSKPVNSMNCEYVIIHRNVN